MNREMYIERGILISLVFSILIFIAAFTSIIAYNFVEDDPGPIGLHYSLEINVNVTQKYTLYLPVLDDKNLIDELRVTKGEAIVTTKTVEPPSSFGSNEALVVEAEGYIEIYGEYWGSNPAILTLMADSEWSYYWMHCEKSKTQNLTVLIIVDVWYKNRPYNWATSNGTSSPEFTHLDNGWNEEFMRGANMGVWEED